ncbi:MAG: ATP-binding protein [bacterium]|nr:ATP-binding protein [bacterium]
MSNLKTETHQPPRPSDQIEIARELPESSNPEASRFSRQGDVALKNGDLSEAVKAYQKAVKADRNDLRSHHNLGVVSYQQENWEMAQSYLDRCVQLAPEDSDLLFKQGLCALKQNRREEASRAFSSVLKLDPDHLRSRFQVALLHARGTATVSRDRQKAIENLEYILEACGRGVSFQNLDRVCFLLGSFLDDHPDNRDQAIAVYRRGLDVDPFFAPGHNNLGVLLMQDGQTLPALGAFKIAVQLEPDYTLPYGNLARLLFDHMSPTQMEQEFGSIVDEFGIQAPSVLVQLSLELIDLGRGQVYESLYTHGHRIKNLMGMSGARMRRLIRDFPQDAHGLDELQSIAHDQEQIFNQWVAYLRSMKQGTMNLTLVDVSQLVHKTTGGLSAQAGSKTLHFASETRVPQVKADAGMLREAVTNLTLNALQAVEEESGKVTVQVGHDPLRASVYIEVEDNGPGIPDAQQARIFDPGYTTRQNGNGYGLSICARIASAHRGHLRLISQPGAGAVFRIDLPIDFEVSAQEDTIGLQRSVADVSTDPVTEEFVL